MKITITSNNELIITSRENLWMLLLLILIVIVLVLAFTKSGFSWIGVGITATALITWAGFAYYATDVDIIMDKNNDIFSFKSSRFFGGKEKIRCRLKQISDVVLETQDVDNYRIGFVTDNSTIYVSKIYNYSFNQKVKKAYKTIRNYIGDQISNNANKPLNKDAP